MHPTFSIVIPAYNRMQELIRALRSCLLQSFSDFEVIVVDDGSEVDLERVALRFNDPRIRYTWQAHRGGAAARNTAISLATGQYIAFLDSDDAFLPTKLAALATLLQHDPTALYFSSVFMDRGIGKLWIKPRTRIVNREDIFDYLFIRQGWVPLSSIVVNTAVAQRVRFNEDLARGQDMQFAIDAWKLGIRLVMVKEPLVLCDDRRSGSRVSQKANVDATGIGPYQSYLDWIESLRPLMSTRAYHAWRAKFKARLIASDSPREAILFLWTAYRSGAFGKLQAMRLASQIFAPNFYWRVSTLAIQLWGIEAYTDVRRLISDCDYGDRR